MCARVESLKREEEKFFCSYSHDDDECKLFGQETARTTIDAKSQNFLSHLVVVACCHCQVYWTGELSLSGVASHRASRRKRRYTLLRHTNNARREQVNTKGGRRRKEQESAAHNARLRLIFVANPRRIHAPTRHTQAVSINCGHTRGNQSARAPTITTNKRRESK